MSELAVIVPYYNFTGFEKPKQNFLKFYEHTTKQGIDLFVGEVALEGKDFLLNPSDKVFQFRTNSILWYKENIINSVVKRLPSKYKYVAWLDADIIYHDANWPELALAELEKFPIVQLFSHCHRLNTDGSIEESLTSFPYWLSVKDADPSVPRAVHGGGWAADRVFFEKHGLYDKNILGGGDALALYAYYGWWTDTAFNYYSDTVIQCHHRWAYPTHEYILGRTGYIDSVPGLLWHGNKVNRLYGTRQTLLTVTNYDPDTDVAYDGHGILRWNSDNKLLQDIIKAYFMDRKEDG